MRFRITVRILKNIKYNEEKTIGLHCLDIFNIFCNIFEILCYAVADPGEGLDSHFWADKNFIAL